MSLSLIGVGNAAPAAVEPKPQAAAPAAAPQQSATLKPDTVSISPGGQAAASAPRGDVDRDGDSH